VAPGPSLRVRLERTFGQARGTTFESAQRGRGRRMRVSGGGSRVQEAHRKLQPGPRQATHKIVGGGSAQKNGKTEMDRLRGPDAGDHAWCSEERDRRPGPTRWGVGICGKKNPQQKHTTPEEKNKLQQWASSWVPAPREPPPVNKKNKGKHKDWGGGPVGELLRNKLRFEPREGPVVGPPTLVREKMGRP